MTTPDNTATDGTQNSSDSSNPLSGVTDAASAAAGAATAGLMTPFTNWLGQIEADTMNVMNQFSNTIFYGACVLGGLLLLTWGMYLLFRDTAPVEGLKTVVGTAAKVL